MSTCTLITHPLPRLPDADTDVIVFFAAGGSTLGAWDGERWIDCTGMPMDEEDVSDRNRVIAWAEFPVSPDTPAAPNDGTNKKHERAMLLAGPRATAFERTYGGHSWTDPDYRNERMTWIAAWDAALAESATPAAAMQAEINELHGILQLVSRELAGIVLSHINGDTKAVAAQLDHVATHHVKFAQLASRECH